MAINFFFNESEMPIFFKSGREKVIDFWLTRCADNLADTLNLLNLDFICLYYGFGSLEKQLDLFLESHLNEHIQ